MTNILFGGDRQTGYIKKDQGASFNEGDKVTYQGRACVVSTGVDSGGNLRLHYPPAKLATDKVDVDLSGLGLDAGGTAKALGSDWVENLDANNWSKTLF